jgi:hypothetical protein
VSHLVDIYNLITGYQPYRSSAIEHGFPALVLLVLDAAERNRRVWQLRTGGWISFQPVRACQGQARTHWFIPWFCVRTAGNAPQTGSRTISVELVTFLRWLSRGHGETVYDVRNHV